MIYRIFKYNRPSINQRIIKMAREWNERFQAETKNSSYIKDDIVFLW